MLSTLWPEYGLKSHRAGPFVEKHIERPVNRLTQGERRLDDARNLSPRYLLPGSLCGVLSGKPCSPKELQGVGATPAAMHIESHESALFTAATQAQSLNVHGRLPEGTAPPLCALAPSVRHDVVPDLHALLLRQRTTVKGAFGGAWYSPSVRIYCWKYTACLTTLLCEDTRAPRQSQKSGILNFNKGVC